MPRTRRAPSAAALIAIAAALATWADTAGACSCADRDERDRLQDGEIGVAGKVAERRTLERIVGGQRLVSAYEYRLSVQRAAGARFGSRATVRVPEDGCGPGPVEVGARLAAFVRKRSYGWLTHGCSVVDPGEFERALRPYPRARGRGRLSLLAGGSFGTARVMALDRRGRILGYGAGAGETRDISVCPGSERSAELVATKGRLAVAVRDLRSLVLVWSTALPIDSADVERTRATVHCDDAAASAVHAGVLDYIQRTRFERTRLFGVQRGRATRVATVSGYALAFGDSVAYVGDSKRIASVDLAGGTVTRLSGALVPQVMATSPDGRWLAVFELDVHGKNRLRLIDPAGGRGRSIRIDGGALAWLSNDELLFRRGGEARVYDTDLRLLRRYPFYRLNGEAHVGERLFGMDRFRLRSLHLGTGDRRTVARLPDRGIVDLVGVAGGPQVAADRAAPGLGFPIAARASGCRPRARG